MATKLFEKVYPDLYPEKIGKKESIKGHFREETFTVGLRSKTDNEIYKTISITKDYINAKGEFLYVVDNLNFYSSFYGIGSLDEDTRKVIHENYMNKELDLIWEAMEEIWEDPKVAKGDVFHVSAVLHSHNEEKDKIYGGWHYFNNIFADEISDIEYILSKERDVRTFRLITVYGDEINIIADIMNDVIDWDGTMVYRDENPHLYFNLLNQTYYIDIISSKLLFTNMVKAQRWEDSYTMNPIKTLREIIHPFFLPVAIYKEDDFSYVLYGTNNNGETYFSLALENYHKNEFDDPFFFVEDTMSYFYSSFSKEDVVLENFICEKLSILWECMDELYHYSEFPKLKDRLHEDVAPDLMNLYLSLDEYIAISELMGEFSSIENNESTEGMDEYTITLVDGSKTVLVYDHKNQCASKDNIIYPKKTCPMEAKAIEFICQSAELILDAYGTY